MEAARGACGTPTAAAAATAAKKPKPKRKPPPQRATAAAWARTARAALPRQAVLVGAAPLEPRAGPSPTLPCFRAAMGMAMTPVPAVLWAGREGWRGQCGDTCAIVARRRSGDRVLLGPGFGAWNQVVLCVYVSCRDVSCFSRVVLFCHVVVVASRIVCLFVPRIRQVSCSLACPSLAACRRARVPSSSLPSGAAAASDDDPHRHHRPRWSAFRVRVLMCARAGTASERSRRSPPDGGVR